MSCSILRANPFLNQRVDKCKALLYIADVIKSFVHKGLENFFKTGSKKGIQPHHASRLRLQLGVLDNAVKPDDVDAPGWALHPLKGDEKGFWAITVNGNWRVVFRFIGKDVELVDYLDYH